MLGRAAYQTPAILLGVDPLWYGARAPARTAEAAVETYLPYVEARLADGAPLHTMTRHMLGLFAGAPGGRIWRRILSERAHKAGAGVDVVRDALDATMSKMREAEARAPALGAV
jgi:tRNA-dihydrouridine synthase A